MSYKSGPREQGRYRVHHKAPPDRLYSLPEMAAVMGISPRTLWNRMRRRDGSAPPAFQPTGPRGQWKFSERSYTQWLDDQERREA